MNSVSVASEIIFYGCNINSKIFMVYSANFASTGYTDDTTCFPNAMKGK